MRRKSLVEIKKGNNPFNLSQRFIARPVKGVILQETSLMPLMITVI